MPSNKERIQRVKRKALENDFYSGCSQAVLGTLQEEFNIGDKESFKAATALSGGVARQGESCGAIIGALMALGLVLGREKMENTEAYRATMIPAAEMCQKFIDELKKQLGFKGKLTGTLCRQIQEKLYGRAFNMADEKERQAFLNAGGHNKTGCPMVCGIAAQVAAEKILELLKSR